MRRAKLGIYKYECKHNPDNCKLLEEGVRQCKECGMVIITDRGVDRIEEKRA